jgi:hypothetical protein
VIQAVNKNSNGISFPIFNDRDIGIIRILSNMSKPLITAHEAGDKKSVLLSTLTELTEFGLSFFKIANFKEQVKFAEFEITKMFNGIKSRIFLFKGDGTAFYLDKDLNLLTNPLSVGIAGTVMDH